MLLESIGHTGHISSVHLAIGWKYTCRRHQELRDKPVLAVAFDRYKGKWDFPGGKNDCRTSADPAVQLLTTMYKEMYEELAVTITAPIETFVLEIVPCGHNGRNMIVVCGIKGLIADLFRDEMRRKQAIRPALPTCFLEMTDFKYLGAAGGSESSNTSYVQSQHMRALKIVEQADESRFPSFDAVMRIDMR